MFPSCALLVRASKKLTLVKQSFAIQRFFHEGDGAPEIWQSAPMTYRRVPNSLDQLTEQMRRPPENVPGSRLLKVAILGEPNAGKSTLVNQLSGWSTCATSKKVHTTRRTSQTVLIEGATQIVFLDTPGLVLPADSKKYYSNTQVIIYSL